MRGLGKIILGCVIVTASLLLYVHERVEMLRTSYVIQRKSTFLAQRSEDFRRLTFEVTQLRSPQALEKRIEELSLPLTLPKQIQVLRISEPSLQSQVPSLPLQVVPQGNLFDFLGQWIQVAQARTEQ